MKYNLIESSDIGVYIGGMRAQSGSQFIHHNIMRNIKISAVEAIGINSSSKVLPTGLYIQNNLFVGKTGARGVTVDVFQNIQVKGNIFSNIVSEYYLYNWGGKFPVLTKCSNNLFIDQFHKASLNVDGDRKNYTSFSAWKSLKSTSNKSLGTDYPDSSSKVAKSGDVFTNAGSGDFTYKSNSPAKGLMPDGSAAGPYQQGNEIIGIVSTN